MLKKIITALSITIVLGLYPFIVLAADIMVATPVTVDTINTAIDSANPGDTVIIPDGTHDRLCDRINPIKIDVQETSNEERQEN